MKPKNIPLLFVIYLLVISCNNDNEIRNENATIIGFNSDKCMCCWGWVIKLGLDTIKSDNVIIGNAIGYEILVPIDVYIELGQEDETCELTSSNFAYFDIKKILVVD